MALYYVRGKGTSWHSMYGQFMNGQSVSVWMVSRLVYEWSVAQFMNGQSVSVWMVSQFMNGQSVSLWMVSWLVYEWSVG